MLVMIEKHKHGYALRIKSGHLAGQLSTNQMEYPNYWPTEDACKKWATETGYRLIKTLSVYRQLEIAKGDGEFFVFTFEGERLFNTYTFKKEATAKEIIDWHHEAI